MKNKIIISIRPEYVSRILDGSKRFEYRRKAAKKDVSSIIIYETAPVKRVVAEAEILEVLSMPPAELWEETKEHSGINKAFFDSYFAGRKIAYAYRLGKVKVFQDPQPLSCYGLSGAPQSFAYVSSPVSSTCFDGASFS